MKFERKNKIYVYELKENENDAVFTQVIELLQKGDILNEGDIIFETEEKKTNESGEGCLGCYIF